MICRFKKNPKSKSKSLVKIWTIIWHFEDMYSWVTRCAHKTYLKCVESLETFHSSSRCSAIYESVIPLLNQCNKYFWIRLQSRYVQKPALWTEGFTNIFAFIALKNYKCYYWLLFIIITKVNHKPRLKDLILISVCEFTYNRISMDSSNRSI